MAEPILLNFPPEDPREALRKRLENAPAEHAEALLSLLDVVQELHDKGLLEIAKGALGSGDNFMIMTKLFASLDPKLLEHLANAVPKALVKAKEEKPMGVLTLLSMMSSAE